MKKQAKLDERHVATFVAQAAFNFWESSDFRILIDFDSLSRTEQDRIFNELEVSILGLIMLYCEEVLKPSLSDKISQEFLNINTQIGVKSKLVDIWRQLISLRFDEYRKDYKISLSESKKMREFKKNEEDLRKIWARIETITIDCLTHIRRGDVKENDKLWSYLRKWFMAVNSTFEQLFENFPKESKEVN